MSLVPVLGPGRNVCLNLEATALAEEPEFKCWLVTWVSG